MWVMIIGTAAAVEGGGPGMQSRKKWARFCWCRPKNCVCMGDFSWFRKKSSQEGERSSQSPLYDQRIFLSRRKALRIRLKVTSSAQWRKPRPSSAPWTRVIDVIWSSAQPLKRNFLKSYQSLGASITSWNPIVIIVIIIWWHQKKHHHDDISVTHNVLPQSEEWREKENKQCGKAFECVQWWTRVSSCENMLSTSIIVSRQILFKISNRSQTIQVLSFASNQQSFVSDLNCRHHCHCRFCWDEAKKREKRDSTFMTSLEASHPSHAQPSNRGMKTEASERNNFYGFHFVVIIIVLAIIVTSNKIHIYSLNVLRVVMSWDGVECERNVKKQLAKNPSSSGRSEPGIKFLTLIAWELYHHRSVSSHPELGAVFFFAIMIN